MWGDGGAGFAFGVRLGFGVGLGFAFDLGAIALGLLDLAARGFAVLGVAVLRLMDFLDVFRFAMSPPGVWLVGQVCVAVGHASVGARRGGDAGDDLHTFRLKSLGLISCADECSCRAHTSFDGENVG
jgi:hypothetical protein